MTPVHFPDPQQLVPALNGRDMHRLVSRFAEDVVSEQPAHPSRNFRSRDPTPANWTDNLAGVPNLHAEAVREAVGAR